MINKVFKLKGTAEEVLTISDNDKHSYIIDLLEDRRTTVMIAQKSKFEKFLKDMLEQIQSDQI